MLRNLAIAALAVALGTSYALAVDEKQFMQLANTGECSGCDLSGADFTGTDMNCTNMTNANLTNAKFTHAIMYGADLTNSDLTGATDAIPFRGEPRLCNTTMPDGQISNRDCKIDNRNC